MKFLTKAALVLVFAVAVVTVEGSVTIDGQALAQDEQPQVVAQAEKQNEEQPKSAVYTYIAQEGDTYSYMARKAVQTYGIVANVKLTPAQIVYAETNLTREAGSPMLNAGQEVQLTESAVKQWTDKARALSPEEAAAWDYYVQFIDFNTNNVGETR